MGCGILRPSACVPSTPGRLVRRSLWPPQGLRRRCIAVCGGICLVRTCTFDRFAHPRARRARSRSGVSGAGKSGYHQRLLFGERARASDRDLVWLHSNHGLHRSGARRLACGERLMALGFLHPSSFLKGNLPTTILLKIEWRESSPPDEPVRDGPVFGSPVDGSEDGGSIILGWDESSIPSNSRDPRLPQL